MSTSEFQAQPLIQNSWWCLPPWRFNDSRLYAGALVCKNIGTLGVPQCRRKPNYDPPPNYNSWPSIFWRPL